MSEHQHVLQACPTLRAYLDRIGAEVLNFRRFMVKIYFRGNYYNERAIIRVRDDYSLDVSHEEFAPTEDEALRIKMELQNAGFPKPIETPSINTLYDYIPRNATIFIFISYLTGHIIMVQQRVEFDNGEKAYVPWTFFSDGVWRRMEPGGALPFWKPYQRRNKNYIMVHEGAKTASFVDDLLHNPARRDELKAHPWGDFLARYEHWGLIGGALAPHRADYAELQREQAIETVYVCDNDRHGQKVLQKFSKYYRRPLKGIRFDNTFPPSWDMADPIPTSHFKRGRYIGIHPSNYLEPATYATDTIIIDGKRINTINDHFLDEWYHAITPDIFIHRDKPNQFFQPSEFNSMVNPFSAVDDTARLIRRDHSSKRVKIVYSPAMAPGPVVSRNGTVMNTHVGPNIQPINGDPTPWLEFLDYLFPLEPERIEVCRWFCTLLLHPEIRMRYGLLLISEQQGIGKNNFADILGYLIGDELEIGNTSHPGESQIMGEYNYWSSHKRLAIIPEIYAGSSTRAYNKLKSIMTDEFISVNKKYFATYEISNWLHIIACSNSKRALKLSDDDRRWYVPEVAETIKPPTYWDNFFEWLKIYDGYNIIKHWAIEFLKRYPYIKTSEPAPWSSQKEEVIEATYSQGEELVMKILANISDTLTSAKQYTGNGIDTQETIDAYNTVRTWETEHRCRDGKVIILDTDLVRAIKHYIYDGRQSNILERPLTVRRVAKGQKWYVGKAAATLKMWPTSSKSRIISNDKALAATSDPKTLASRELQSRGEHLLPLLLTDPSVWSM